MAFEIRKTSNYGTRHSVVARLKVQTHELIQWADLAEDKKRGVVAAYSDLAERLLKCHEIYRRLTAALNRVMVEVRPNADSRVKNVPHLIGLTAEVETFLYEGKNYLRDLLHVIKIFFDAEFDNASAFYDPKGMGKSDLVVWARKKFGAEDHFATMLASEQEWTEELIRKRNAVEHRGGRSGTLHVKNFTQSPDGCFTLPNWFRDQNEPLGLFPDLENYLDNMLTLAEDLLVCCIHHDMEHGIIQFVEIPPADRRTDCPVRLSVQIDPSKLKPPI
jgi:hypothetical protein